MYRLVYTLIRDEEGNAISPKDFEYHDTQIISDDYYELDEKRIDMIKNNTLGSPYSKVRYFIKIKKE